MTFATTTYVPATQGGHRYLRSAGPNSPCAVLGCNADPWHTVHDLVEKHLPEYCGALAFAVEASDDGGRSYAANGLRWASQADAERWASGLAMRWFGCTNIRVVECTFDGTPTDRVVHQTL